MPRIHGRVGPLIGIDNHLRFLRQKNLEIIVLLHHQRDLYTDIDFVSMLRLTYSRFKNPPCIDTHFVRHSLSASFSKCVIPSTQAGRRGLLTLAIESSW